jgi:hypothetical protein
MVDCISLAHKLNILIYFKDQNHVGMVMFISDQSDLQTYQSVVNKSINGN